MLTKRISLNLSVLALLILALLLAACSPVPAPATVAVIPTEAASPAAGGEAEVNANPVEGQIEASPTVSDEISPDTTPAETPNPVLTLPILAPTPEPPIVGEIPEALMTKLTGDIQSRASVAPDAITIVRAEAMTWSDGSLGCPQPGVFYTQALVDGFWVVLQVGDAFYDYRTSGTEFFMLCEPQTSHFQKPLSTAPPIVVLHFTAQHCPVTVTL